MTSFACMSGCRSSKAQCRERQLLIASRLTNRRMRYPGLLLCKINRFTSRLNLFHFLFHRKIRLYSIEIKYIIRNLLNQSNELIQMEVSLDFGKIWLEYHCYLLKLIYLSFRHDIFKNFLITLIFRQETRRIRASNQIEFHFSCKHSLFSSRTAIVVCSRFPADLFHQEIKPRVQRWSHHSNYMWYTHKSVTTGAMPNFARHHHALWFPFCQRLTMIHYPRSRGGIIDR